MAKGKVRAGDPVVILEKHEAEKVLETKLKTPGPQNFSQAVALVQESHPDLPRKIVRRKAKHAFRNLYQDYLSSGGTRV